MFEVLSEQKEFRLTCQNVNKRLRLTT